MKYLLFFLLTGFGRKTIRRLGKLCLACIIAVFIFANIGCTVPVAEVGSSNKLMQSTADTREPAQTKTPTSDTEADVTTIPVPTVEADRMEKPSITNAPEIAATKEPDSTPVPTKTPVKKLSVSDIPAYSGKAYVPVFDNKPSFSDADLSETSFEVYSSLDSLGRCGVAYANVGKDLMPKMERGEIGQIKPSGWHTVKYDCIEDLFLYNRCHLIAYCLSGENDNEKNLITGTRYMNVEGMLPLESKVANYVDSTGNHVLYRVTPIYEGDNLVCNGVQIEAMSVEDNGKGICFNVFCYNVQPDIVIDYTTGDSYQENSEINRGPVESSGSIYVLNTNTKKFHYPSCSSADDIKEKNRAEFVGDRQEVIDKGYSPCKRCNP